MKRKTVTSSNIKAVGYDISNQILELEFNNGGVYFYKNVGLQIVVEFIFADSLGKYFSKNIRTKFEFVNGEYNVQWSQRFW